MGSNPTLSATPFVLGSRHLGDLEQYGLAVRLTEWPTSSAPPIGPAWLQFRVAVHDGGLTQEAAAAPRHQSEVEMGSQSSHACRSCGTTFSVQEGGGFSFDELHCDTCGSVTSVGHEDLGDIHLRYVKGLDMPYAVVRAEMDHRIQQEYPGDPLTEAGYHAAAEATLDPCACGGRYRYDAPPRCPTCRSTSEMWDEDDTGGFVIYD